MNPLSVLLASSVRRSIRLVLPVNPCRALSSPPYERILIIFRGRILLLRSILQSMKGMRIVVEEPTSIYAEFTSGLKWSLFCGKGSRQAPTS